MQMIIQGSWLDQSILINIPHFTDAIVVKLGKMGIFYLPQLIEKVQGNLKKFLRQTLKEPFTEDEMVEIYQALDRVPKIDL